ncbi:MAG: bifunctional metallophosphatase/5'-nucleotidase [Bacteroidetes bacterium]|nr:MAG: bifunctional metallophosphatase/5'-nucleotidase [Bacteroidota bacterium]
MPRSFKNVSKYVNTARSAGFMLKNIAKRSRILHLGVIILLLFTACKQDQITVRIAVTTDVHGMIYPHDFISRAPSDHSLAHIYKYVSEQRTKQDTFFFLLDNGDFLQGQPTVYYYNFVDTFQEHLSARVMNYMEYDAGTVGNHDIETGPQVYKRVGDSFQFPWLAANAVNSTTGLPYFEPYTILKAGSKRIAILGLITPGIPGWLPKNLWAEMEFRDMVETAQEWVPHIIEKEKPDLLVGLFHSGTDASYGGNPDAYMNENAVMLVAEQVPGFHIIFAGHDHRVSTQQIANIEGDSVLIIDPGSHGRFAGEATITFGSQGMQIRGENIPMQAYDPSEAFLEQFAKEYETVSEYLEDTITWLAADMVGLDALFGPSSMLSLIHNVQLDLSAAQISFTAPLSISAVLREGPLLVSDMFKLYRFENMLYRMDLTGAEIDGFLEHAVGSWFNTMSGPGDHLLLFGPNQPGRLASPYYNFSSAAGINYTVDVTGNPGDRVSIQALSDGSPFNEANTYSVALNSYRGNGGGGHLTAGAGIPKEELANRIAWSTDRDLRFYLMDYLRQQDTLYPLTRQNWACIPVHFTGPASISDRKILD